MCILQTRTCVVNMHNKTAKKNRILFLLFTGFFCCQNWCKLQLLLNLLSLFSAELLSLQDRASCCQPALILLSLDKGEQHWVWLPRCSHTHALTHLCTHVCMYLYAHAHTRPCTVPISSCDIHGLTMSTDPPTPLPRQRGATLLTHTHTCTLMCVLVCIRVCTYLYTHMSMHCSYIMLLYNQHLLITTVYMYHLFHLNPSPHSDFLDSTTLDISFHLPPCPFRSQTRLPEEMTKDCTT